jgi:hypothetical protein
MALRGALSRGFNVGLAIVLLALPIVAVCLGYALGSISPTRDLISFLVAYLLGVLAGLPALVLNRKGLTERYDALDGRFFLSSQLALLDSRHGRNAVAYFYVVVCLAILAFPFLAKFALLEGAGGFIVQGIYLSANVLPFVFPPRGKK